MTSLVDLPEGESVSLHVTSRHYQPLDGPLQLDTVY